MLIPAIANYFKYKVVSSIIVLACWPASDRVKFIKELSYHGLGAKCSCDPSVLDNVENEFLPGILFFNDADDVLFHMINKKYFSNAYKWLIIGNKLPETLHKARYDIDMAAILLPLNDLMCLNHVYVHPRDGVSLHPWGQWAHDTGLVLTHERERILRKLNLNKYPLKIATPIGHYSRDWYNGTIEEYLMDESLSQYDSGIRCGYLGSNLLIEILNATKINIPTLLWGADIHNDSMVVMLETGEADLSGAILRILGDRITRLDFVLSIWPFSVGFTYLAERESSSNMFVEPFTTGVWMSCLALGIILAFAQRICAKSPDEKDGAYIAVLATWLQQDASAVPAGASGRWTFMVLSVSAMLVHAYYTSAIVSALMSSGSNSLDSLRALGDSQYAIASEDYDFMRYLFFDVKTNWNDLEYLKQKKKTSNFYQDLDKGVELIRQGSTAFHSEYNQIYPHFNTFTDDQICKLQNVDTIPQILTWITSSVNGQWSEVLHSRGGWLREVGITKRLVSRLVAIRPECRSSLLAERVKFGDVAPLLGLATFGAVFSFILLGLEILVAKGRRTRRNPVGGDVVMDLEND